MPKSLLDSFSQAFCGKYSNAVRKVERTRGDLKGSQIFGFKTPKAKRLAPPPTSKRINEKGISSFPSCIDDKFAIYCKLNNWPHSAIK